MQRARLFAVGSRAGGLVLAAGATWLTFRNVDTARVAELLRVVPASTALLLLVPPLLGLSLETLGWSWLFARFARPVRLAALWRVRVATEALAQSLPAGPLLSESTKPFLLVERCGLDMPDALTGVAARKVLVLWAHAAYLSIAFVVGYSFMARASHRFWGKPGGEWLVLVASAGLAGAALGASGLFGRGAPATRLFAALRRIRVARWEHALERRAAAFAATDQRLAAFFDGGLTASLPSFLLFLAAWLIESVETFLILRVLGVELPFSAVIAMEVVVSFLRNVLFVLPAGLGVQDFGYVAFLGTLGVPDPVATGAAFSLLKRGKELSWIAIGYGLLVLVPGRRAAVTRAIDSRARAESLRAAH